ncbi:hypothetical protein RvY_07335-1 [Ramazzottius varieornatus]|uniref:HIT domain-containing protein n=1 Tax=Ramazzottius varieornatus TaxID=947166 RepID=A0A1D1V1S5_RAMVA|nr:hypothetical protein RvY_07335-1 [Ramazzottius varieornatus]
MSRKRAAPEEDKSKSVKRGSFNPSWQNGLEVSLKDTASHLYSDELVVIIRDKFPKAKHHFLLLPQACIDNLELLDESHVMLLEHMIEKGKDFAKTNIEPKTKNSVRLGFHMVPSMSHLHMHIISQDFDSIYLKNKKHWNSFASPFFRDAESVLEILKKNGKASIDKKKGEELLKQPLRCHVCKELPANIPRLKEHIKRHDKDRS